MPGSARPPVRLACLTASLTLVAVPALWAQEAGTTTPPAAAARWAPREVLATERYVRPPEEIERLVTAPRQNTVALTDQSPDGRHFLWQRTGGLPTVNVFGKPHFYFGGLQVDGAANRARTLTTRGLSGLTVVDAASGAKREIDVPSGATVSSPVWSPDGKRIAYIANFADASRLYVADAASGKSRRLTATPLLATLVTDLAWTGDGKRVVAVFVPGSRMARPVEPKIETGPLVRLTDGHKDRTRNYASLLRDPYERALMEYYVTGQLAAVDAGSGDVRRVGAPGMIFAVDPSPDGQLFRVTLLQKPFSYIVQYTAFAQTDELWDAAGKRVATLASRPLRESDTRGFDDAPAGGPGADSVRRSFGWMPNGKGLYFLKQDPAPARGTSPDSVTTARNVDTSTVGVTTDSADGPGRGRGAGGPRRKDRLVQWTAPFTAASEKTLLESDNRINNVLFSDDASVVFVAENAQGTGAVYATYLNEPGKRHQLWRLRGVNASVVPARGFGGAFGRGGNGDDSLTFYQNPGALVTKGGRLGGTVARLSPDGASAYFQGTRYAKSWIDRAPRGFLDRVDIRTAKKTPLFLGDSTASESVEAVLDDGARQILVEREGPQTVPDAFVRDLASGKLSKVTSNADPSPAFTALQRKRVAVTRADGVRFYVDVTLPADYRPGTRLPGMFWFYPYEYTDQAGYDRTLRTQNINQFPNGGPRTIEYLATQGYAVANFSPPIVGTQGRMNDNYVSDLRNNLYAVIDELDRQGYIDRARLGIGGHSYGAFSTVNAMVNTPFFKAGIAGDGMYNRTLTPNGFQSERRDFWEAQKTYVDMSPFFNADKLTGALLMYHSIEDQNVGTDPISSVRMLHALQGLGKTASLYMYPYEDHGPATRETILDQWARWVAWLDVYVKNANPKTPPPPAGDAITGKPATTRGVAGGATASAVPQR